MVLGPLISIALEVFIGILLPALAIASSWSSGVEDIYPRSVEIPKMILRTMLRVSIVCQWTLRVPNAAHSTKHRPAETCRDHWCLAGGSGTGGSDDRRPPEEKRCTSVVKFPIGL